jgi:hypothetical protein
MRRDYLYRQIKLIEQLGSENIANALIGSNTLGIEITNAELADACDLGNIDPQHGFARGPDIVGRAAIDVALGWPPPPPGATLATIRPDTDSFGAMAVLSLRTEGVKFTPAMRARIELVARSDCFDFGDWATWSAAHPPPLPGAKHISAHLHPPQVRALAAAIALCRDDLSGGVAIMGDWLTTGTVPAQVEAEVRKADMHAAAAWGLGQISVTPLCGGIIAYVKSDFRGAMVLGYCTTPVVISESALGTVRKITIAQFAPGHVDMALLALRLNLLESGWGGSATILGSPQSMGPALEITTIIHLIQEIGVTL